MSQDPKCADRLLSSFGFAESIFSRLPITHYCRCSDGPPRKQPELHYSLLIFAFCLLTSSCGYHVAGKGDRLPPDVKTIAIPIFVNQTPRFKIEQLLSGAITQEFLERTKFRITPDPNQADAVLRGTVTNVNSGVVTYDLATGRATTLLIQVNANVVLTDSRSKKVLFSNPAYVFRQEYQISQSAPSLIEEDQPALKRLSQDMARTLVTDILENF